MERTIAKVGGTIVSALATIGFTVLDIREAISFWGYTVEWGWFSLGAFIFFLIFVGWWLGSLYNKTHNLENIRSAD